MEWQIIMYPTSAPHDTPNIQNLPKHAPASYGKPKFDQTSLKRQLAGIVHLLPTTNKITFGNDLIAFHGKYGGWTDGQTKAAKDLIALAKPSNTHINILPNSDPSYPEAGNFLKHTITHKLHVGPNNVVSKAVKNVSDVQIGANFTKMVELLKTPGSKLKWPKITIILGGAVSGEFAQKKIVFALQTDSQGGIIKITNGKKFGSKDYRWYGNVTVEGAWKQTNAARTLGAPLEELLIDLAIDPVKVVVNNGKLTGQCCFCHTPLTDPHSLAAGFGPVCAKHYGLLHTWNNALHSGTGFGSGLI